MADMGMGDMGGMAMDHGSMPGMPPMSGMDHSAMPGMSGMPHGTMEMPPAGSPRTGVEVDNVAMMPGDRLSDPAGDAAHGGISQIPAPP